VYAGNHEEAGERIAGRVPADYFTLARKNAQMKVVLDRFHQGLWEVPRIALECALGMSGHVTWVAVLSPPGRVLATSHREASRNSPLSRTSDFITALIVTLIASRAQASTRCGSATGVQAQAEVVSGS